MTGPALDVDFVVAYPRKAKVGQQYLLTVDVIVKDGPWPYGPAEEYPLDCIVGASPAFQCRSLGGGAVVLHRFGGTYGPAEFVLTAKKEAEHVELRVTLINRAGIAVKVLKFDDVSVVGAGETIPARPAVKLRSAVDEIPRPGEPNRDVGGADAPEQAPAERPSAWVEISARGHRAERLPVGTIPLERGLALQTFSSHVARAARTGKPLDAAMIREAQAWYDELISGELRDLLARVSAAVQDYPVLIRLFVEDPALQAVPWEALCTPGTSMGFLGMDPGILLARGVDSAEPWEPRTIGGAVRVLAIAPAGDSAFRVLREALGEQIASGVIEWLDPIEGPAAQPRHLFERLRRGPTPHVLHFLGHGGIDKGTPVLCFRDDDDGSDVWVTVEAIARELSASFKAGLRLVILESDDGARPGTLGSAAEILARAGADAVVAHLGSVKTDVARTCSKVIYRSLFGEDRARGDIGASVTAARRTLLGELEQSAEAFSPVLLLRGAGSQIFDFATPRKKAPFHVPFLPNASFVGREDDLARLHAMLQKSAAVDARSTALTGMGGIGKTQLAVEYAYRYAEAYPGGVYWVNAAQPLQAEFARLAIEVGLEAGEGAQSERQLRLALTFAKYLRERADALVVLDNVEDPLALRSGEPGLVPVQLGCWLLFTTRVRDLRYTFANIEVGALSPAAAIELLLSTNARRHLLATGTEAERAEAEAICRMLGHLPLAVALAAAFLDQNPKIALGDYRSRLEREGALATVDESNVNALDLPTRHDATFGATLLLQWRSLEGMGRKSQDARLLMMTTALLREAAPVPLARLALLTGLRDRAEPGYPTPLGTALRTLRDLSLMEEPTEGEIGLHPLVREFAERQIEDRQAFAAGCATRLVEALGDMGRLHEEVARRGIEAVLGDLQIGSKLAGTSGQAPIEALIRPLDRESYALRGWDAAKDPGFLLQQLRNRCLEMGIEDVREWAEEMLEEEGWSWLRERIRTSRESDALARTPEGHTSQVTGVAVTPDGILAVSASSDNTLKVWDMGTGQVVRTFDGHTSQVTGVAVTPDGRFVVSASYDNALKVWDFATGRVLRTLEGHTGGVTSVAVAADGRSAISASLDSTLRVWDLATGQTLRILEAIDYKFSAEEEYEDIGAGHASGMTGVAVTAYGRSVISASMDNKLRMWDLATGRMIRTLEGHTGEVTSVAVTAYDRFAVSASVDKTLKVWDVDTGQVVRTLEGHTEAVTSVAVTPDDHFAVSVSGDKTLKVWDLNTGQEIVTLEAPGPLVCCAVLPDGLTFVAGDRAGALHIVNWMNPRYSESSTASSTPA